MEHHTSLESFFRGFRNLREENFNEGVGELIDRVLCPMPSLRTMALVAYVKSVKSTGNTRLQDPEILSRLAGYEEFSLLASRVREWCVLSENEFESAAIKHNFPWLLPSRFYPYLLKRTIAGESEEMTLWLVKKYGLHRPFETLSGKERKIIASSRLDSHLLDETDPKVTAMSYLQLRALRYARCSVQWQATSHLHFFLLFLCPNFRYPKGDLQTLYLSALKNGYQEETRIFKRFIPNPQASEVLECAVQGECFEFLRERISSVRRIGKFEGARECGRSSSRMKIRMSDTRPEKGQRIEGVEHSDMWIFMTRFILKHDKPSLLPLVFPITSPYFDPTSDLLSPSPDVRSQIKQIIALLANNRTILGSLNTGCLDFLLSWLNNVFHHPIFDRYRDGLFLRQRVVRVYKTQRRARGGNRDNRPSEEFRLLRDLDVHGLIPWALMEEMYRSFGSSHNM